MLNTPEFHVSSETPSEDKQGVTVQSRATATELYRRHFDDEAIKAKIKLTPQSPVENRLHTLDAIEVIFEDVLPENLADKLAERSSDVASFNPLQEWDGYVIEVNANSFRARLTDITNDGAVDEDEVEIPFSELDEDSQSQLAEGRLLRWSIGYQRSRTGQKTRVSRIIVRRLPAWRREDLDAAKSEARKLSRKLRWE